jgi:hypothetical protein
LGKKEKRNGSLRGWEPLLFSYEGFMKKYKELKHFSETRLRGFPHL